MATTDWKTIVDENFVECSSAVAACLSCSAALLLDDVSVCPAVVLVGPPSTAKTTVLDFFQIEGLPHLLVKTSKYFFFFLGLPLVPFFTI